MEISELLDLAKERANLPSDYALAKVLGIATGNLSNIRKGRTHPSNEEAVKLATLAGIDEMRVIAEIELRTANSDKKKKFWKHYIENRGVAATLGLIALGTGLILTPEPAQASVLQLRNYGAQNSVFEPSEIYIMRNRRSRKRLILRAMMYKVFQLIRPKYIDNSVYSFLQP